jgi:hypothetical protein
VCLGTILLPICCVACAPRCTLDRADSVCPSDGACGALVVPSTLHTTGHCLSGCAFLTCQEADADRQTALTIAISDDVLSAWRSVSAVLSAVAAHDSVLSASDKPKTSSPQLHSGRRSLTRVHRRNVRFEASAYCCTQSLRMRAQGGHARKREYGARI